MINSDLFPFPLDLVESKMVDGQRWIKVFSHDTAADFSGFLKALDVWIEKPHVVNRRLMGALIVKKSSFESSTLEKDLETILDQMKFFEQDKITSNGECKELKYEEEESDNHVGNMSTDKLGRHENGDLTEPVNNELKEKDILLLRKLLPRQLDKRDAMLELVIIGGILEFSNALFPSVKPQLKSRYLTSCLFHQDCSFPSLKFVVDRHFFFFLMERLV